MKSQIENQIVDAIKTVYDPEIHVNVYDIGLIYDIGVDKDTVDIKMTLTSAFCPSAESLPKEVEEAVLEIKGINSVNVEIVWDPPWTQDMMSEEAKLELGIY